jgi:hypothetical protein
LPSIIPSYVYTLFASLIVGALIISMVGLAVANVKREAEEQELSNVAKYVAVKSMQLTSNTPADNLTSTVSLDIPAAVGNQRYWISIQNDSAKVWVEVGFGNTVMQNDITARIPSELAASGIYISGSGTAFLDYSSDATGAQLTLRGGE